MKEDENGEGVKRSEKKRNYNTYRNPSKDGVLKMQHRIPFRKSLELGTHFSRMLFVFHVKDMVKGEG